MPRVAHFLRKLLWPSRHSYLGGRGLRGKLSQQPVLPWVNVGCSLVNEEDFIASKESPGEGEELSLSSAQVGSAGLNLCVQPLLRGLKGFPQLDLKGGRGFDKLS